MSDTFITSGPGAVYAVRPLDPAAAADAGCPDATHALTGRTGTTLARWTPRPGAALVRVPHPGWADQGRCAVSGAFTARWNSTAAPSAVRGHLVTR